MSSSSLLKNYSESEELIKSLYNSKLRLGILSALKEEDMALSDLRRKVDANAPNTSAKAKDLENLGLVEREGGVYSLTDLGYVVEMQLNKSLEFYAVCEKFKDFWSMHRMDGIPPDFLARLGDLKNSEIIKISQDNVDAPLEMLFSTITSANKRFYGLCTFYHKLWSKLTPHVLNEDVDGLLILSRPVLQEAFKDSAKLYPAKMVDYIDKRFAFYEIQENFLPAFMITEKAFAMALELKEVPNAYLQSILFSNDPMAIQWALDLLEHYKKAAKKVKFKDYVRK